MADIIKKGNNVKLADMDIMQHIQNIYNILGTNNISSSTVMEKISENKESINIDWFGTAEEYKAAKTSGKITPRMLCYITDRDDFNPREE